MLILTRRTSETICIGDEVTVTVLAVKGNQVRFGIVAPRSVSVDRLEVKQRKDREEKGGDVDGNVADHYDNFSEQGLTPGEGST